MRRDPLTFLFLCLHCLNGTRKCHCYTQLQMEHKRVQNIYNHYCIHYQASCLLVPLGDLTCKRYHIYNFNMIRSFQEIYVCSDKHTKDEKKIYHWQLLKCEGSLQRLSELKPSPCLLVTILLPRLESQTVVYCFCAFDRDLLLHIYNAERVSKINKDLEYLECLTFFSLYTNLI